MIVLYHFHGIVAHFFLFRTFFTLKHYPSNDRWWFLAPRLKGIKFVLSFSIKRWNNRFFFASIEGIDWIWSDPDQSSNQNPQVELADWEVHDQLGTTQIPSLEVQLSEQNLFDAGINPIPDLGELSGLSPSISFWWILLG